VLQGVYSKLQRLICP